LLWLLKPLRRLFGLSSGESGLGPAAGPPPTRSGLHALEALAAEGAGLGPPDDPEALLCWLEQQAERAHEAMYDARPGSAVAASYNDAKEFLYDAIGLAERLGHTATALRLSQRLDAIKAVHRSQF
jgi:hypothetical protein